ncbi:MAG: TonB family protein [Chloroherpetonaceae bacterium]
MRTATLSLGAERVSGWYVATPHAFARRDEMGKRMLFGGMIAVALYLLVLSAYFISTQNQDVPITLSTRKPIVVNSIEITPPTPPDVRQESKPIETISTKDLAAGIIENLKNEAELTNETMREAVKMAATLAIENGLSNALDAIDKAFGDGLPTPIEGSKNSGVLTALEGRLSGLVGFNQGSSENTFGLGIGIQDGFNAVGNSGGLGEATKTNLGGNQQRGTGLGRQGVKVAVRKQNLILKENLRPAEDIARILEKYQPTLQDLYTEFRVIGNAKATVQFVIAPDGVVTHAQLATKSFSNPNFERGIMTTIRRMRFSTIQAKANQTVTVPFNFSEENN